jgi:hypothetical protein
MAAKEIKRLDANGTLSQAILDAIKKAHEAGLSTDDVKATLERFASLLEEE